ncbi:hypothetical protein U1707_18645 [Sphingomonas sp. PB2P12]|uniref:hypothetical protein n=1 Tax=Sphingomonas sandaracina TaxID=3096157 RepID=UPI002FC6E6F1
MSGQPTSQPTVRRHSSLMPSTSGLLELFSQTPGSKDAVQNSRRETSRLWHADAIHRAKNLSQMAISLAAVADHPSRRWLRPETSAQVRSLARAYDVLSEADDGSHQVPCTALLTEIATRLTDIFGKTRGVSVRLDVPSILVAPSVRRVLILLCSELIINALKYAYPSNIGGVIGVRLQTDESNIHLTVEDEGVGLSGSSSTGEGSGLIEQLCAVAGAAFTRASGANGRGLRVDIRVPVMIPATRDDD